MKIITDRDIESLNIGPKEAIEWVREAFLIKGESQLPPKVSLHPRGIDFVNTMPCILPKEYHTYGCKIVSRVKGQHPALNSKMMVFDTLTGKMTALLDADWITTMRTSAVAVLAIDTLQKSEASVYSFIGLGAIGQCTIDCLTSYYSGRPVTIRLKRYKDHAEKVVGMFRDRANVTWEICDTVEALVDDADVVVSCVTEAAELLVDDAERFKPGCLVVPVHTRGFQNCDRVFDKVFADDEGHVRGFRYFSEFRKFGEIGDVLAGKIPGRENDVERILSYNVGIGLQDIYYGVKILEMYKDCIIGGGNWKIINYLIAA